MGATWDMASPRETTRPVLSASRWRLPAMPAGPLRHAEGPLAVADGAMASGGDLGAFTLRPSG
ncbi:hypothetical protein BJF86_03605 [Serinicoccus sp. CNJ-927]|nr:hypothetical protein BJF86_03605 [Serinicoccus sp. CNJ-927]